MQAARTARQAALAEADALLSGLDAYLLNALGLSAPKEDTRQVFGVTLGQMRQNNRMNTEYFHPERITAIREQEARTSLRSERLIDIADFVRDTAPSNSSDHYIGLANVQSHTGELVDTNEEVEGQCFRFQKNDVLFGRLRPYLNKVYCAEQEGVCSTEFHVIRLHPGDDPKKEIDAHYLALALRSSLVLAQTRHMMTGNTHPRLTNEDVINLVVPLPPLSLQTSIAQEVTARREKARRLRVQAAAQWEAAKAWFERRLLGEEPLP